MADIKISALSALTDVAVGDLLPIVDVSDTTQAATGSTKKVTITNLTAGLSIASDTAAGTMSSAHFIFLNNASATAVENTLVKRTEGGDIISTGIFATSIHLPNAAHFTLGSSDYIQSYAGDLYMDCASGMYHFRVAGSSIEAFTISPVGTAGFAGGEILLNVDSSASFAGGLSVIDADGFFYASSIEVPGGFLANPGFVSSDALTGINTSDGSVSFAGGNFQINSNGHLSNNDIILESGLGLYNVDGMWIINGDGSAIFANSLINFVNDGSASFADGAATIQSDGQIRVASLAVGNSASATVGVGVLAKKVQIFDASGTSLGFVPIYASIT